MRLTVPQADLLPALQSVSRSVGIRSTLPVLANVLIQADDNQLVLSSTNLEIGVIKTLKAEISEPGAVTIPAKTLVEVIASLSGEIVTLEASEAQIHISTKKFKASLNGIPATEFPNIPLASEGGISINPKVLQQALPEITFAAASDDGRPILTGILTQLKKSTLELVATDGFRLSHKTLPVDQTTDLDVLIPRRTFEEVVRLISEEKTDTTLEIATSEGQNQIVFKIGDTQLSSRLIEGQFPNWERIVPTTFESTATVDRSDLLKAVKLASVFARDNSNIIRISCSSEGLTLTSEAKELGGQETQIEATVEGKDLTVAFNSRFLIESLSSCPGDQVVIQFSGSLSPALIKPIKEAGLEYVIMPVRLA